MSKGAYIGVPTKTPIIATRVNPITASTIADYFEVEHPLSGGNGFTGNEGVFSSVAASSSSGTATSKTKWTAKGSFKGVSLDYVVGSKPKLSAVDFYITVAGVEVVSSATAGETGHWSGAINEGETIVFYSKNADVASAVSNVAVATDYITGYENKGIARKVKKGYIGVDGLARKIKKAYIGIGGVARPCWSGGELAYYGTITGLGVAEYGVVSANVGDYALFAGNDSSTVTVYNSSLIRSTTTLSGTGSSWTAAGVGNYALFGGYMKSNRPYGTVNAFDTSLTRTSPTSLGYARYSMGGTSVGNYALFAGGYNNSIAYVANVDAYNKSLTRSTPTSLDWACEQPQGAKVGNYGLFCGGYNGIASNNVAAYNASLTYSTPTVLSVGRYNNGSSTIGDYALIGGGAADSGNENAVDAYSASLTRSTPTSLSVARCGLSATTVGEYALFGGGIANSKSDVVDAYDANLIRSTLTPLSVARYDLGAATIGKYALFAGGTDSNGAFSSVVDAYTIA